MTNYSQYVAVMKEFKRYKHKSNIEVFAYGADINIKVPYIVVKSYGISNEELGVSPNIRLDKTGYNIYVYGANIGRTMAIMSNLMDAFLAHRFMVNGEWLHFSKLEYTGDITRLEDDIYEGVITAWVSSTNTK